jgi:hypothetical protein
LRPNILTAVVTYRPNHRCMQKCDAPDKLEKSHVDRSF